jgi:cytoskeletal protein CcmA (bactofilin family)
MFKGDAATGTETLIGPSVHVKGDFKSQGNVQIEGQVTGTIQTGGNLKIGEQAKINANVAASNAWVAGSIKGNVMVGERLELSPSAKIEGDVSAKVLVMAEGAQLNGRCQMSGSALIASENIRNRKDKVTVEASTAAAKS